MGENLVGADVMPAKVEDDHKAEDETMVDEMEVGAAPVSMVIEIIINHRVAIGMFSTLIHA